MAVLHKYQVVRKRLRGTFYEDRPGLTLTAKNFESLSESYSNIEKIDQRKSCKTTVNLKILEANLEFTVLKKSEIKIDACCRVVQGNAFKYKSILRKCLTQCFNQYLSFSKKTPKVTNGKKRKLLAGFYYTKAKFF